MIAEEVENGEKDGSNTSSIIENTSSAAAILRCGGRNVKQEVYSASSKRDVWACVWIHYRCQIFGSVREKRIVPIMDRSYGLRASTAKRSS